MDTPRRTSPALSRRRFLTGSAGAAALAGIGGPGLLAACSGDSSDTGDEESGDGGNTDAGSPLLLALFAPQGVLVSGAEQRTVFAIADAEGVPLTDPPAEQTFSVLRDGQEIESVAVPLQAEGIPTGHYPVKFTPPEPGDYEITTTVDGSELVPRAFFVSPPEEISIPGVGDTMLPLDTPTVDDPRGVDPICTRTPPCPLHEITLTAALEEDRPTAFLIATPEFCQTALCGPVLDVLLAEVDANPDIRFVHAEVFADPRAVDNIAEATLAEAPQAYALPFEPALYLANSDTTISARLDNLYASGELRAELAKLS